MPKLGRYGSRLVLQPHELPATITVAGTPPVCNYPNELSCYSMPEAATLCNTHLSDYESFGITERASRNSRQSALETTLSERSPQELPGSTGIPVPDNSVSASLTNSSAVLQPFPVETNDFSMVFTNGASPVSPQPATAAGGMLATQLGTGIFRCFRFFFTFLPSFWSPGSTGAV